MNYFKLCGMIFFVCLIFKIVIIEGFVCFRRSEILLIGIVEIFYDDKWGIICSYDWNI